jgi:death on curing protein
MYRFLSLDEVWYIHRMSLQEFGGSDGVRDQGLVESALASAQNAFLYMDGDVFDVAAAYAFHLAEAQAFLDGNKRTGIGAALAFMMFNQSMPRPTQEIEQLLYDAMIAIASHQLDKAGLAALFRKLFS